MQLINDPRLLREVRLSSQPLGTQGTPTSQPSCAHVALLLLIKIPLLVGEGRCRALAVVGGAVADDLLVGPFHVIHSPFVLERNRNTTLDQTATLINPVHRHSCIRPHTTQGHGVNRKSTSVQGSKCITEDGLKWG